MSESKELPPVELAMTATADGKKITRRLPCKLSEIRQALKAKRLLGLPVELSQRECRKMADTTKDLKHLFDDPAALESRKRTNSFRTRIAEQVSRWCS